MADPFESCARPPCPLDPDPIVRRPPAAHGRAGARPPERSHRVRPRPRPDRGGPASATLGSPTRLIPYLASWTRDQALRLVRARPGRPAPGRADRHGRRPHRPRRARDERGRRCASPRSTPRPASPRPDPGPRQVSLRVRPSRRSTPRSPRRAATPAPSSSAPRPTTRLRPQRRHPRPVRPSVDAVERALPAPPRPVARSGPGMSATCRSGCPTSSAPRFLSQRARLVGTGPAAGEQGRQVQGLSPITGCGEVRSRSTLFLCFAVDDIDAAVARVRAAGGTAGEPTRRALRADIGVRRRPGTCGSPCSSRPAGEDGPAAAPAAPTVTSPT